MSVAIAGLVNTVAVNFQNPDIPKSNIPAAPYSLPEKSTAVVLKNKVYLEQLQKPTRALANYTLKNASEETCQAMRKLYCNFGKMIEKFGLDENDLDFLMQATPDARSEYSSKYTPDKNERLAKLAEFRKSLLAAKDGKLPENFNKNIEIHSANLESFMTAIGYSAIFEDLQKNPGMGPPWVKKTGLPSQNLINFIQTIQQGSFLVPSIGDEVAHGFKTRWKEDSKGDPKWDQTSKIEVFHPQIAEKKASELSNVTKHIHIPQGLQEPLPGSIMPAQPGLSERVFTENSYVDNGLNSGIAMRAHVSGSVPITLASIKFINNEGVNLPGCDKDLPIYAGVIVALYESGDYHSPAETAAGICHYHQVSEGNQIYFRSDKPANEQYLEDIPPKNYLAISIGFMNRIIKENALYQFNKMAEPMLELTKDKGRIESNNPNSFLKKVAHFFKTTFPIGV